jgi:hypothetical protein
MSDSEARLRGRAMKAAKKRRSISEPVCQQELKNQKTGVLLKHKIFNYYRQAILSVQKHYNGNALLLLRFCIAKAYQNDADAHMTDEIR